MPCTISDIINDISYDINSPKSTKFSENVGAFQDSVKQLHKTFDSDVATLVKIKKTIKAVHASGIEHVSKQLALCDVLDSLSDSGLYPDVEMDLQQIGSGICKYSVVLRDLVTKYQNQMRQLTNFLLFPLHTFLKDTLNQDSRKHFDKSVKDFQSRVEKVRKDRLQTAKELGHPRPPPDAPPHPEDIEKEKKILQVHLCEFLISVNELNAKKGSEFFLHLIDYFQLQRRYFLEGKETMEHLAVFLADLQAKVSAYKASQDDQRRALHVLREDLRRWMQTQHSSSSSTGGNSLSSAASSRHHTNSSLCNDISTQPTNTAGYSLQQRHLHNDNNITDTEIDGVLYKRSESKVKRQWLKRNVKVKNGRMFVYHGTNEKPPVVLPLLTCQLKDVRTSQTAPPTSQRQLNLAQLETAGDVENLTGSGSLGMASLGSHCFDLVSNNRTYHFMTEREADKRRWMTVLHNAMEQVFQEAMQQGDTAIQPSSASPRNRSPPSSESFLSIGRKQHRRSHSTGYTAHAVVDTLVSTLHRSKADSSSKDPVIEVIQTLPGNDVCADCDRKNPDWVSTNLGILICLECCGVHRQLGVHLSRTQSLAMDHLTSHELILPRFMGNARFNHVFEANLPADTKPAFRNSTIAAGSSEEMMTMQRRKTFIMAKYKDRTYVTPHQGDKYEALVRAVRRSSLQEVLQVHGSHCELLKPLEKSVDQSQNTALHVAVAAGGFSSESGASLLVRQSRSADPKNLACIAFLLQNAPNSEYVYHTNLEEQTVAHFCAQYDHPEALKLIIKTCGVTDKMLKKVSKSGATALEVAESRGHTQVAQLLRHWAEVVLVQESARMPSANRAPSALPPVTDWTFVMNLQTQWFDIDIQEDDEEEEESNKASTLTDIDSKNKSVAVGVSNKSVTRSATVTAIPEVILRKAPRQLGTTLSVGRQDRPGPPAVAPKPRATSYIFPSTPRQHLSTGESSTGIQPPVEEQEQIHRDTGQLQQSANFQEGARRETLRPNLRPETGQRSVSPVLSTSPSYQQKSSQPKSESSSSSSSSFTAARTSSSPRQKQVPTKLGVSRRARALYDHVAESEGELSFRKGDILVVLGEAFSYWWRGYLERDPNQSGVFPSEYVMEMS